MQNMQLTTSGANQIDAEKSAMRRTIGAAREAMAASVRAHQTCCCVDQLRALPVYQSAEKILCTMSFGSELDTRVMIEQMRADGKQVVLPRVAQSFASSASSASSAGSGPAATDLLLFLTGANTPLETSKRGLTEPTLAAQPVRPDELDLVIVPGLAFDSQGNRLGYGRGYFDRLLKKLPATSKCVALCFDCQLVGRVPVSDRDEKIDILISATAVRTISK